MSNVKRIKAIFFKTELGKEPVRDWLMSLPKDERQRLEKTLKLWNLGFL